MTLIRVTKNYALLEVLRPVLDLNAIAKRTIFKNMYQDVLLDANKEGYLLLNKFCSFGSCPFGSDNLSSLCGSIKCDPDLLGEDFNLYFYL